MLFALILGIAHQAQAYLVYLDSGEHNLDFEVDDPEGVLVTNLEGEPPTILNVLTGAFIHNELQASRDSIINVFDGSIGWVNHRGSQMTMYGGSISGELYSNLATVDIYDGSIGEDLRLVGSSANIFDGSIGADLYASGSYLNISGGLIGGEIWLDGHITATIAGTGFNYDYGEITRPWIILTGTLANGDPINNWIELDGKSKLILVTPEPSTILLLGLGVVLLRRKRTA
ncbi:MAG: PEP-CTERM sorting domain-containing protein [Planctomycetota bacterium]|jgi:hypothetical protein